VPVIPIKNRIKSPFWLPGGHTQSVFPALFREVELANRPTRERLETVDGDFLDVDWYINQGDIDQAPLLIISHGLEGSSERNYVKGLIRVMLGEGYNILAWNYRSCSGELNRALRFYHSGATDDLDFIIRQAHSRGANQISLAGFSLGGNLTLKWIGEQGENPPYFIRKAVAFSVPLHLSSSSRKLARWENRIYTHRFLQTLLKKVNEKSALYPNDLRADMLKSIKSLRDFDEVITGPLHGFKDAEDYYEQNSSLYFLEKIRIPALIVNAQNDPFLTEECIPFKLAESLDFVYLEAPVVGGHCGFYPQNYQGITWSEKRAAEWFKN
jgi:predicted alpha/beta-fold hydrolase